ncbi:hypothetical protein BC332_09346 [Capsicum chinense]|nr:hypothetical protein BC332_09346 [Capsicum chinense]
MASGSVVGFVGLDDISLELATSLLHSGYSVQAFEAGSPLVDKFLKLGGKVCANATEATKGVAALVILLSHADQINDLILGDEGVLNECYGTNFVVDMYVSKAVSEVLNDKTMIISSGSSESIARAQPILSAMCSKLYNFEGEVGAGSKAKMVIELLEGIHSVASVEAICLGAQAGIHPWILYDIISNAAGNSCLKILIIMFVVSLTAVEFLFPDSPLVHFRVWESLLGVNLADAVNSKSYNPEELASQITSQSDTVKRIGFIGLGAMGFGMATHLLKSNFCVIGYDVYPPSLSRFADAGGLTGSTPAEASQDVDVLIVMVTNELQAESVLYGDQGAVSALPSGASVILSSTVSPSFVSQLEKRLQSDPKKLKLVDSPVSGGVKRAADGTLTIMASGTDEALKHTGSVLAGADRSVLA